MHNNLVLRSTSQKSQLISLKIINFARHPDPTKLWCRFQILNDVIGIATEKKKLYQACADFSSRFFTLAHLFPRRTLQKRASSAILDSNREENYCDVSLFETPEHILVY